MNGQFIISHEMKPDLNQGFTVLVYILVRFVFFGKFVSDMTM